MRTMAGWRLGHERNTVAEIPGSKKQLVLPQPPFFIAEGHTIMKKPTLVARRNNNKHQTQQAQEQELSDKALDEGNDDHATSSRRPEAHGPLASTFKPGTGNGRVLVPNSSRRHALVQKKQGEVTGVSSRGINTDRGSTTIPIMTSLIRDLSSDSVQEQRHFSKKVEEFTKRYSVEYGGRAAGVPLLASIRESYNVDSSILVPRGTNTNAAIHVLRDKVRALKEQKDFMEYENIELLEDMNNVIDENFELVEQVENLQRYIKAVEQNVETLEEERNYLLEEVESAERHWKRELTEKEELEQHVKALTELLIVHGVLPPPPSAEEPPTIAPIVETTATTSATKKLTAKKIFNKTKKVMKKGGIISVKRGGGNHNAAAGGDRHFNLGRGFSTSSSFSNNDKAPSTASETSASGTSSPVILSPRFKIAPSGQSNREVNEKTLQGQAHESTESEHANRTSEENEVADQNKHNVTWKNGGGQGQFVDEGYLFYDDDDVASDRNTSSKEQRIATSTNFTQPNLRGRSQHHIQHGDDTVPPPSASATANQRTSPSTRATIPEISHAENEDESLSASAPTNQTNQSFEMKRVQSVPYLAERAAAAAGDNEYFLM